jgi:hypothetical protein
MGYKSIFRYIVTDYVSIPVCRVGKKAEQYKCVTKPGYGLIDWYSASNNYKVPVNRDVNDKTQMLLCDEDSSAVIYDIYGKEYIISSIDNINLRELPKQADVEAIIISGSYGYDFWAKRDIDVKIFVTYDEYGLIDTYRLDSWMGRPYDGETEISFNELQSEEEYESIDRKDIKGTYENMRLHKSGLSA